MDKITYTYTDTFGGELNFCWARRVRASSVREAKKLLGLTNVPFRKNGNGRWEQVGACCAIVRDDY